MDDTALMDFLHRFVGDLGATVAAGAVVVGDSLGLYKALATAAQRPDELAAATGTAPRYVEEWLRGQAAGGYVQYDTATGQYSMTEEQAFALTDPDGPLFLPGAFQLALGTLAAVPHIAEAFRSGDGVAWKDQHHDVFVGCERFFRPGYVANLVSAWLPALDGVEAKLRAGATVADIGCGLGSSTILMAQAYPQTTVTGSDYHDGSIELARKRAVDAGLMHRVGFEVAGADSFHGGPYDLVTTFDCLHDMGDPVGAARHVRERLADDGTWMVVEPMAGDTVESNLNPVGRVYYSFSTFLCVPNAVSQGAARTLGAQAGEAAIRAVTEEAGFTRFRRVAETPFNLVYEIRP
jgi:2-polyprenyl-3-methyl-5-hydroxy-6-metoxy-1,4-benzoquinol methylase